MASQVAPVASVALRHTLPADSQLVIPHAILLLHAAQSRYLFLQGVAYGQNITQFDKGEYSDSNNPQDDFKVMGQFLDLLPQQYGSSLSTATAISAPGTPVTGVITKPGQMDFFSFSAKAGAATLTAAGEGTITTSAGSSYPIGNLDMQLTLYDSSGSVITTKNPAGASAEALGASMQVNLPSDGAYFVSITGVGAGNPKVDGYSNYGCRGHYSLTVQYSKGSGGGIPSNDPLDCVGSWSDWGSCSTDCSQTSVYHIVSPAKGGGRPCDAAEGAVRTRRCSLQDCQQGPNSPSPPAPPPDSPPPPPSKGVKIQLPQITMERIPASTKRANNYRCTATMTVKSVRGKVLRKAAVLGHWSTDINPSKGFDQDVTLKTTARGVAKSASKVVTGQGCTFTVTDIRLDGYVYTSSSARSEGSISWRSN